MEAIIELLQRLTLTYTAVAQTNSDESNSNNASLKDQDKEKASTSSTSSQVKKEPGKTAETITEEKVNVANVVGAPQNVNDNANGEGTSAENAIDLEKTLQPQVPKDFELFLNLVEFCRLVLLPSKATPTKHGSSHLSISFSSCSSSPFSIFPVL